MAGTTTDMFAPEVRARGADGAGKDHRSRWAAEGSIAAKIGSAGTTLHEWVKKAEVELR